MKTTKQIIEELSKYPEDLEWYVAGGIDDDPKGLVSVYTGNMDNAQGWIEIGDDDS